MSKRFRMNYQFDTFTKSVLIRCRKDGVPEILHKGDKEWIHLTPRQDYKDESYCRAIYLGQGCWEDLHSISEEEAEAILKEWGFSDESVNEQ